MRFSGAGQFNETYLDKKSTTTINGIFVILVLLSHYMQYAHFGGIIDEPYLLLRAHLHQMVVATFLFYSGYGMMEQIKRKGDTYVRSLPKKAGKLLFRFDVSVLLFLLMHLAFGKTYSFNWIVPSLIGWKDVGNSNWYIFDILVLYVLMFMAFGLISLIKQACRGEAAKIHPAGEDAMAGGFFNRHPNLPGLILFTILTLAFVYVMMKAEKGTRWYNTVILLPVGCFYSEFRKELERLIMKNDVTYYLTLLVIFVVYCFSYLHRDSYGIEGYTVWAFAFIAMVILLTMKVSICNPVLEWFGKHVFSIYILQRIPMIVLSRIGLIEAHKYLSLIAVFALTIPLAIVFDKVTGALLDSFDRIGKSKRAT